MLHNYKPVQQLTDDFPILAQAETPFGELYVVGCLYLESGVDRELFPKDAIVVGLDYIAGAVMDVLQPVMEYGFDFESIGGSEDLSLFAPGNAIREGRDKFQTEAEWRAAATELLILLIKLQSQKISAFDYTKAAVIKKGQK